MSNPTVELIASGYEFICPSCDRLNHEIELSEDVVCRECGCECDVIDFHHAFKR